jgi:uncharacterized protein (TIGR00725 family)
MKPGRASVVAVIGPGDASPDLLRTAERVGRLLAQRGAVLVCGGRGGVMEAACRGAQQAGGTTVGVLPGTDPNEGNDYLSIALPTGMGEVRNALVARAGRAVIAIGGGYGTLSEIGLALKAGLRVIGLGTWRAVDAEGAPAMVLVAGNPDEAVALALSES